jgi:hypothetical protein
MHHYSAERDAAASDPPEALSLDALEFRIFALERECQELRQRVTLNEQRQGWLEGACYNTWPRRLGRFVLGLFVRRGR